MITGGSAAITFHGIDTANDVVKVFDSAASAGAKSATVFTDTVADEGLLRLFRRLAETGGTHLGGTVTQIGPDSFRLD